MPSIRYRGMKRRTYVELAGTVGAGSIAGCTGAFGGSQWNNTVGLAAPTSGPLGVLGGPVIEGGQAAVEEVKSNTDGLEMQVGDTAGNPEAALSVARDMQDDGIVTISNVIVSDVALALKEFAEEEEIPHVGAFSGSQDLTDEGTDYFFRQGGNNAQYAAATVQFFEEQDVSNIAIISLNDAYGNAIVDLTEQYASETGLSIEYTSIVPPGTTNFKPELSKIDNGSIGGIYIPYHGKGQTALAQQLREAGLFADNVLIGDYAWGNIAAFKKPAGENAAGIHFHGVDLTGSETEAVASRISERFGGEVGTYRIIGYDTAKMTAQAMSNADSVNPSAVRDEIQATDYTGISGWEVEFNETGDNDAFQLIVNKWESAEDGIQASDPVFKSDKIPGDDPASIL
jgi:branched-chain amino acid transport system substrate-binding protein